MARDQDRRRDSDARADGLDRIVAALNAGQAERALEGCAALLATAPVDPALNELAGHAALRLGRHDEAVGFAERSLASRADHVATLVLLGRARRGAGLFAPAAEAFGRAAALAPGRADVTFLACATLLEAGDPAAVSLLDGLQRRFPRESEGWEAIGRVLLASGKREAAAVCLSRAMQASPRLPLSISLGLLLRDLGRPAEAGRVLAQAVRLDAGSTRAWFLLGLCAQDTGDSVAAVPAYREALVLDPSLAEAAVNLGTVLQECGDLDGAKDAYGRALGLRADTFGRIAQAITTAPKGELWLDLGALRRALERRAFTPGPE